MAELRDYVVVISWWGSKGADGEGSPTDKLVPLVSSFSFLLSRIVALCYRNIFGYCSYILQVAEKYGAHIAFHLEPYTGLFIFSVLRFV